MTTTSGPAASASASPLDPAAGEVAGEPAEGVDEMTARVWRNLRTVLLERGERRKDVVEALGMSFFRVKVLRRVAVAPAPLSELATRLGSDRPYLTLVVDDLAKRGLVERHQHPTDRRSKIVSATPEGRAVAARAEEILGTPPPALRALPEADLAALDRIMTTLAAAEDDEG